MVETNVWIGDRFPSCQTECYKCGEPHLIGQFDCATLHSLADKRSACIFQGNEVLVESGIKKRRPATVCFYTVQAGINNIKVIAKDYDARAVTRN